jgi:hypothetical protein
VLPQILENQGELLFHLHQQRLIELIRSGNIEEALAFAAEYLAPAGEEQPRLLEELGEMYAEESIRAGCTAGGETPPTLSLSDV